MEVDRAGSSSSASLALTEEENDNAVGPPACLGWLDRARNPAVASEVQPAHKWFKWPGERVCAKLGGAGIAIHLLVDDALARSLAGRIVDELLHLTWTTSHEGIVRAPPGPVRCVSISSASFAFT